ncbi:uncharacterized protein LOC134223261 isoform X2 [Armigeres subalbatus]|uniref:uncharacterized protein LOC134223261 isoform X2 n=1 Tax=Armigeres subalbatus TaxID=124917 RepID=UPI002ED4AA3A
MANLDTQGTGRHPTPLNAWYVFSSSTDQIELTFRQPMAQRNYLPTTGAQVFWNAICVTPLYIAPLRVEPNLPLYHRTVCRLGPVQLCGSLNEKFSAFCSQLDSTVQKMTCEMLMAANAILYLVSNVFIRYLHYIK